MERILSGSQPYRHDTERGLCRSRCSEIDDERETSTYLSYAPSL